MQQQNAVTYKVIIFVFILISHCLTSTNNCIQKLKTEILESAWFLIRHMIVIMFSLTSSTAGYRPPSSHATRQGPELGSSKFAS